MFNVRSPNSIVKFNCIKEIFTTHTNLNDNDKKYGITYICTLVDDISEEFKESFYRFLLYTNKSTYTGTFACIYNDYFEDAVREKKEKILKNMVLDSKETAFFELFNNKLITEQDKTQLLSIVGTELSASKQAVELAIGKNDIFTPILVGGGSLYYTEFIDLKYKETGVHISPVVQTKIYLTDKIMGCRTKNIFTFNLWDLLLEISKDNMNPKTKAQFSFAVYETLKNKYEIELKLISRYLKDKK